MIFPPRSTSMTGVPSSGRSPGSVRLPAVYTGGCSQEQYRVGRGVGHPRLVELALHPPGVLIRDEPGSDHAQLAHRVDATPPAGRVHRAVHPCQSRVVPSALLAHRPGDANSSTAQLRLSPQCRLRTNRRAHDQPTGAGRARTGRGAEAAQAAQADRGMGHRRAGRLLAIVRAGRRLVHRQADRGSEERQRRLSACDSRVDEGRQGVGAIPDRADRCPDSSSTNATVG